GLKKALGPEDPRVQDLLDRMLAEEGMELDDLTELLMRGGGSELEMAIRASGQNAGLERLMYFLQVGFFSRRISDRFDWSTIEADLEKIMEVVLRRRHREKPKLVTICDVSDSVRNASRFMLQLVWSLQECFSRVRSYAFVSEIAEVTQAFSIYPVERAIEWALKAAPVDYHCRSDFGYAFNRFAKTELDSLDRKTTILILGDARNNYNDPQAWALRHIRERVKGIIWLNPEGQWGWGIGDSVMPLYAPACDFVRECRTIGQLGLVVAAAPVPHGRRRARRVHQRQRARRLPARAVFAYRGAEGGQVHLEREGARRDASDLQLRAHASARPPERRPGQGRVGRGARERARRLQEVLRRVGHAQAGGRRRAHRLRRHPVDSAGRLRELPCLPGIALPKDILVVEDEPDIRRLVVLHLEREGFRCRTASNGAEALREAKHVVPDLVVLDLMLPVIDGLEVCRRLRGDEGTTAVPIIMLTAKSEEVD